MSEATFERNPATLDQRWREVSAGIYRLDGTLLVVLDVARLLAAVGAFRGGVTNAASSLGMP